MVILGVDSVDVSERLINLRSCLKSLQGAYSGLKADLELLTKSNYEHQVRQSSIDSVAAAKDAVVKLTEGKRVADLIADEPESGLKKEILELATEVNEAVRDIKLLSQIVNSSLKFKMNFIDTILAVARPGSQTVRSSTYSNSGKKSEKVENVGSRIKI